MKKVTSLVSLIITLSAGCVPSVVGASNVDVTVEGTVIPSSCTLSTYGSSHRFDVMTGSSGTYFPFPVFVTCNSEGVNTRLYMSVRSGTLSNSTTVKMNGSGSESSSNPPELQLLSNGSAIVLDGSGVSDDSSTFCNGSVTRTCNVMPRIMVPANAATGLMRASLSITMNYI